MTDARLALYLLLNSASEEGASVLLNLSMDDYESLALAGAEVVVVLVLLVVASLNYRILEY